MREIASHRMVDGWEKDAFVGRASVVDIDDVENDLVQSLFLQVRGYASLRRRS